MGSGGTGGGTANHNLSTQDIAWTAMSGLSYGSGYQDPDDSGVYPGVVYPGIPFPGVDPGWGPPVSPGYGPGVSPFWPTGPTIGVGGIIGGSPPDLSDLLGGDNPPPLLNLPPWVPPWPTTIPPFDLGISPTWPPGFHIDGRYPSWDPPSSGGPSDPRDDPAYPIRPRDPDNPLGPGLGPFRPGGGHDGPPRR